jgi:CheY-like chemotaxis protein
MERAAAAGSAFPLVILDARMPGLDGLALAGRIRRSPALADTGIIMLTTADRPVDYATSRKLGIGGRLRKPVKRSELFASIIELVSPQADGTARSLQVPVFVRSPHRLRLLLVEDNPVNQKVAVRLLERRGHEVVVAADGAEALAILDKASGRKFDVVLMDVQMPGMGGFEATAAIRARERTTGTHVPIVAMTASAMKDELESCLRAGMDTHLAKPVRSADLYRVVESFGGASAVPGVRGGKGAGGSLNEAALMAHVGGDEQLLHEIVDLFLEDLPERLAAVRKAVRRRDALALSSAAHALKGAVSHFAARDSFEFALKLERMGRAGDLDGAEEALSGLKNEIAGLTRTLAAYRGQTKPRREAAKGRKLPAGKHAKRSASTAVLKVKPRRPAGRQAGRGADRRRR